MPPLAAPSAAGRDRIPERARRRLALGAVLTAVACGGSQPSTSREQGGSAGAQSGAGTSQGGASGTGGSAPSTGGVGNLGATGASGGAGAPATGGVGTAGSPEAAGRAGAAPITGGGPGTSGAPSGGRGGTASNMAGGGGTSGATSGAAGAGGARPIVTASPGTTLVKVNPSAHHQTFEGWGTSLCWWASHVGGWSADARNAVVDAVTDPVSGLGYNVFRYNIGGGENPAHEHMEQYREMPGLEPSQGTWAWDADANQLAILQRIVANESDAILEAFANSPPYWLTKSGCASGSSDGSNNLKDDSYDAFADYLTEVVKHYQESFGIKFRTLEPLNEPNANWWKSNGSQEGCHFSPSNQETLIKAVAAQLTAKGLTDTTVSASDENSMDDAYNNLRAFASTTMAVVSQLNTHSYAGSKRAELRALATSKSKRLWQSESGPLNQTLSDDTDAALFMAGRIIQDLRDLGAEAWVDWQVGDPGRSWATFTLNDAEESFAPLKRFYMHAGFSRYIRPGATFVDVNNADMVAAVSGDGHTLTLVVRNGDTAATKGFTFDLTALPTVGATAEAHRTSRSENLASLAAVAIADYSFVVTLPAYSVTTFVIPMP